MRRYEKYINSDVFYIDEIPSNWKISRVNDITISITGFPFKSSNYTEQGIKLVRGINVKEGVLNWNDTACWPDISHSLSKYLLYDGDVLIQMDGSKVGLNYSFVTKNDLPLLLLQRVTRLRAIKNIDSKFLFYNFANRAFYNWVSFIKTDPMVPHISLKDINNFVVALPTFSEQQSIANYLDAKTQAIDKKVTLLEQKIETYKKLKNTIIAKAVTHGIANQELSINDFGFKTPANWGKCRLKDLGKLYSGLSGKSGDDFNQDDNPNNRGFIPFTNIANNTYLKNDHLGTVAINPGERQNKVRKGDLFFLMSSEGYGDIGKTAVLADDIEEAYLNSFCKGYRVNQNKCNPYFLNYLLLSSIYRQRLLVEGKGFTRINLKMEKVTDFEIFIPSSASEQEEIAKYLDQKTAIIDAIVGNIRKQIETLKQLRKTLINDVVTGKMMVAEEHNYSLTN